MDRKAWSSTVREAAESQTTLSTSIYLYLQLINVVRTSGAQLTGEDKTTWTGLCSVGEL